MPDKDLIPMNPLAFGERIHRVVEGELLAPGEFSDQERMDRIKAWPGLTVMILGPLGPNWIYDLFMRTQGSTEASEFKGFSPDAIWIDELVDYKSSQIPSFEFEVHRSPNLFAEYVGKILEDEEQRNRLDKGRRTRVLQAKAHVPGTQFQVDPNPSGNRKERRAAKADKKHRRW